MNTINTSLPITIAIPTYRRESILIDTLNYLLALQAAPAEIIVIDQTEVHEPETENALHDLFASGKIHWLRLAVPSIPQAMNRGLLAAKQDLVLFLDDDIRPDPDLIAAHCAAHQQYRDVLVAGRVLQPWHNSQPDPPDKPFGFNSLEARGVEEFMGGNFSLPREAALDIGSFDENFVRVAYRFEADFAHRWRASGRSIQYVPEALIHHLKIASGGTRTFGEHLTTLKPDHAVGAYYFLFKTYRAKAIAKVLHRFCRACVTRHHLKKPWYIPLTFISEIRGLLWAIALISQGPRYLTNPE